MDNTGAKVCAGAGLALAAAFTIYELFWIVDSAMIALPMMALGVAVALTALSVLLSTR